MMLSRRGFLQIAGLSLVATQLDLLQPLTALAAGVPARGRVLEAVTVGGKALWPDSVVTILDTDEYRYRLREGWVARTAIQPMFLDPFEGSWPAYVNHVEVTAPIVPVYAMSSTSAPVLARYGHGGVLRVMGSPLRRDDGQPEWFPVPFDGQDGWVQASRVRPMEWVEWTDPRRVVDRIVVDRAAQQVTAFSGAEPLLVAPVSTSSDSPPEAGRFVAAIVIPVERLRNHLSGRRMSWTVFADDWLMGGAHWHNAFGAPHEGQSIQAPPAVARWLSVTMRGGARFEVV